MQQKDALVLPWRWWMAADRQAGPRPSSDSNGRGFQVARLVSSTAANLVGVDVPPTANPNPHHPETTSELKLHQHVS